MTFTNPIKHNVYKIFLGPVFHKRMNERTIVSTLLTITLAGPSLFTVLRFYSNHACKARSFMDRIGLDWIGLDWKSEFLYA